MFEEIFTAIQEKNQEIRLMGVWGKDGLELERKIFKPLPGVDMDLTGAELADVITKLQTMKLSPEKYIIALNFHEHLLLIYSLTRDFFFLVISDPAITPGKLQFYLSIYQQRMIQSL